MPASVSLIAARIPAIPAPMTAHRNERACPSIRRSIPSPASVSPPHPVRRVRNDHGMTTTDTAPSALVRTSLDDDGVFTITLADAAHRNALRLEMTQALAAAVDHGIGAGARALILAADPPVFCAGGSLDDLISPRAPLEETYAGFLAIAGCAMPTIAAVGGACIGAGVNLPLACDVVIATPEARFDPRWLD